MAEIIRSRVLKGKQCPYCGRDAVRASSKEIYRGKDYGPIMICRPCGAYVGFHDDGRVLGRLANAELREAKKAAHKAFDRLWREKLIRRGHAYRKLRQWLNCGPDENHIGMCDVDQCRIIIENANAEYDILVAERESSRG